MTRPSARSVLQRVKRSLRSVPAVSRGRSMLVPQGRSRWVAGVLTALIVAGSITQLTVDRVTGLPSDAVVSVGDSVVTQPEFRQQVDLLEALYGVRPPTQGPPRDRFQRDAAQALAASRVVQQSAADRGIAVSDRDARNALRTIIQSQFPQRGRQAFVQALSNLGVSERDVLDEITRQLTATRLFQRVTADVPPVSAPRVRRAYQQRQQQMVVPERRRLRNIVLDTRGRAQQVASQARAGGNFADLARQSSLDQSTKQQGGDLGLLARAQLAQPFARAAFSTPAGSVFGPVRTRFGWNVGKVVRVEPSRQLTFDRVKQRLRAQLTGERKRQEWREWLAGQIKAADVTYAPDYRPQNPDALPPVVRR